MKYCPSCGKAGVEGMKFCPQCGQRLTDFKLEERQGQMHQPKVPSKKGNWFERHPGWTLFLVIICSPFIIYGIFVGLVMLVALFASSIPAIAEAIFRGTIAVTPFVYIAVVIFAVRWYKQKKRQRRTIADCGKAIKLNPSDADSYYKRGAVYNETGEYEKAIADHSKAIELAPNHAMFYYERGCSYAELGEDEKAVADYSKAVEVNPNLATAYHGRGLAYSREGQVPEALRDLEKCIGLSTDPELMKAAQQALRKAKNSARKGWR